MGYCTWKNGSSLEKKYHDEEWGVPLKDDQRQFEFLSLEVLQCGLNWRLMLEKREVFREAFLDFDYEKIALFTEKDMLRILNIPSMLKSRRKITAIIKNAQAFLKMRKKYGSFSAYLWKFSQGKTIIYEGHPTGKVPVKNGLSTMIAKDLKKYGFSFVGGITIYSHLEACGIILDHDINCPRYNYLVKKYPTIILPRTEEIF